jgi:hypothetical protein
MSISPTFWKLSQGTDFFQHREILQSIDEKLVYVHKDTPAKGKLRTSQAEHFVRADIGDYFYLTNGNRGIYTLGQFTGPANIFSRKGDGWLDRPFRVIEPSRRRPAYDGEKKWWTPNANSTFIRVPEDEHALFEALILEPFFDIQLSSFGIA